MNLWRDGYDGLAFDDVRIFMSRPLLGIRGGRQLWRIAKKKLESGLQSPDQDSDFKLWLHSSCTGGN